MHAHHRVEKRLGGTKAPTILEATVDLAKFIREIKTVMTGLLDCKRAEVSSTSLCMHYLTDMESIAEVKLHAPRMLS